LLSPATQNIRVVSVAPAGAMHYGPDLQGDLGVVYVEAPRPASGDLVIEVRMEFDSCDSGARSATSSLVAWTATGSSPSATSWPRS
jgi:hypothetical protein